VYMLVKPLAAEGKLKSRTTERGHGVFTWVDGKKSSDLYTGSYYYIVLKSLLIYRLHSVEKPASKACHDFSMHIARTFPISSRPSTLLKSG